MQRVVIKETNQENKNELAFHNMRIAENIFDLNIFINSSELYFKTNPGKNYQDLEKELRERNFETHIIAKKYNLSNNMILRPVNNSIVKCEYLAIISCRPKKYAMQELLENSSSYRENFNKLPNAGNLGCLNVSSTERSDSHLKIYNNEELNFRNKLISGNYEIYIEEIDVETFIKHLKLELTEKFGKEPILSQVGKNANGDKIMTFVNDNKIVSSYGIIYNINKDGVIDKKIITIQ